MLTDADNAAGAVTLAEISQLWWFADGAIMDSDTRAHLHRSWGLCARHAWLYFRVEIELRIHPLGNAVLMADLVDRAVEVLSSHRSVHHKLAELEVHDTCFTCDYGGRGSRRFAAQQRSVNAGSRTAEWCVPCQDVWQPRICSMCAPRRDARSAVQCRQHRAHGQNARDELGYLTDLARRVAVCVKSLTADGPDRTADSDAALVEAIGWCFGWHPELALRRWTSEPGSAS